ncbi:hypothetical protein PHYPSEUDO_003006, partial [Phytophthora pseudosyringae]
RSVVCRLAHGKKKPQQGNHIDQQLLVLEYDDGKCHSKELTLCLNEYATKIDALQKKKHRIEEEVRVKRYPALTGLNILQLPFGDHVARDDPFFIDQTAEKLSNLRLPGNNLIARLELERKEVGGVSDLANPVGRNHPGPAGDEAVRAGGARACMDDMYTKTSTETLSKTNKVARVGVEVEMESRPSYWR